MKSLVCVNYICKIKLFSRFNTQVLPLRFASDHSFLHQKCTIYLMGEKNMNGFNTNTTLRTDPNLKQQ